ncbi:hypothetical protein EX30DRAFT_157072 [Ascodesmis nigricans]|uniref:Uncharacterized protein n=1 Tax=Ascodesmis nigricans TaxID=341454 RepID=A0A4S2MS89_9PEZI|nr:hypothetical protein EX30DRAFT_157072 [Ascodesmis nigricans]
MMISTGIQIMFLVMRDTRRLKSAASGLYHSVWVSFVTQWGAQAAMVMRIHSLVKLRIVEPPNYHVQGHPDSPSPIMAKSFLNYRSLYFA